MSCKGCKFENKHDFSYCSQCKRNYTGADAGLYLDRYEKTTAPEEEKSAFFIVIVNCYYLRDTQVLYPEKFPIPQDAETEEFSNIYNNDDNWKDLRQDAYLGYYRWPKEDAEGLKQYIAKQRGLDPVTLEVFPVK